MGWASLKITKFQMHFCFGCIGPEAHLDFSLILFCGCVSRDVTNNALFHLLGVGRGGNGGIAENDGTKVLPMIGYVFMIKFRTKSSV